jgi:hypothetical protein
MNFICIINNMTKQAINVWSAEMRAPFKKVIAFDLLFLGLGAIIGAGIITLVLNQ